MEEGYVVMF